MKSEIDLKPSQRWGRGQEGQSAHCRQSETRPIPNTVHTRTNLGGCQPDFWRAPEGIKHPWVAVLCSMHMPRLEGHKNGTLCRTPATLSLSCWYKTNNFWCPQRYFCPQVPVGTTVIAPSFLSSTQDVGVPSRGLGQGCFMLPPFLNSKRERQGLCRDSALVTPGPALPVLVG